MHERDPEPVLSKVEMIERDRRSCFDLITEAIRTGDLTAKREEISTAISRCSGWADSFNRLPAMLDPLSKIVEHSSPDVAASFVYPTIFADWSICDNTWNDLPKLLAMLRYCKDHRWEWLPSTARSTYDRLPEELTVFRGCSEDLMDGLSWTRCRTVAKRFALRHCGFDPHTVVVTATVKKSDIFFMRHSRRERECFLDPEGLQLLSVRPFPRKEAMSWFQESLAADPLFG